MDRRFQKILLLSFSYFDKLYIKWREHLFLLITFHHAYPIGIVLLLYFFSVQLAFGTCIIAIRLNDQVVVGADSKINRADSMIPAKEPYCKIGVGDGFFFAISGIVLEEKTGFNPYMIISKAPKIHGTIEQKGEWFERMIGKPLFEMLERYRRGSPSNYELLFQRTSSPLQIIFFGVEKGSSFVLATYFAPTSRSARDPVEITTYRYKCPGDCPNGEQIFMLGEHHAIDRFLSGEPNFWKKDPVGAVRKLIELEIADDPEIVGPPIDILQIDRNGTRWIQKKAQCPDIQ